MLNLNDPTVLMKLKDVSITVVDNIMKETFHVTITLIQNANVENMLEVIKFLGFKEKFITLASDKNGYVTATANIGMKIND